MQSSRVLRKKIFLMTFQELGARKEIFQVSFEPSNVKPKQRKLYSSDASDSIREIAIKNSSSTLAPSAMVQVYLMTMLGLYLLKVIMR